MSQFWRRWHISLISWLTDYILHASVFQFQKIWDVGDSDSSYANFLISEYGTARALTFIFGVFCRVHFKYRSNYK